ATGAMLCHFYEVPEPVLLAASAGLLGTGHALAVAGVARARRGDGMVWRQAPALRRTAGRPARRPFRSASQALVWMSWRRRGFTLPLMVGLLTLTHILLLSFLSDAAGASFVLGPFLMPLMFASSAGATLAGRSMTVTQDSRLPAFVAVRPVPTAAFLTAQIRV